MPASTRGAEMQPVSQRSMLERQQQMMRDMDEPLTVLEGSVNNLQQVSTMIRTEINLQNRLLDNANETTDRTSARLGRARSMLTRFQSLDRNRWLGISVLLLFIALVILFVYEVLP
ncbi:SYP51 [Symbiodinium sp. CCMP2456]|nr:SYP51 [Symbiodinium sp. CCMP2456]